ncbi:hypothetical protein Tco_0925892 [Tanacetum coccineum]|uniref:Uncharacterized protein n=1 Tax=Tanacetum coccineum TaxID=301880 RepID=A0ABQ5DAY1_9ASTR
MSTQKFTETHNLVWFLEKPEESNGFKEIIDFLNASSVQYALTIQALVNKKKVIITEMSIRSDLKLDNAEGTDCLPTATIFAELERMGYENLTQKLTFYKAYFSSQWKSLIHTILQCLSAKTTSWNEFSSTMASAIIYFAAPIDSHSTPIHTQPSSSKPQKKKFRRKQRKDSGPTKPIPDEATNEEHVATPSCDPPQSGKKIADLDVEAEELVAIDPVTTAGEVVTTDNVEVTTANAPTTTIE